MATTNLSNVDVPATWRYSLRPLACSQWHRLLAWALACSSAATCMGCLVLVAVQPSLPAWGALFASAAVASLAAEAAKALSLQRSPASKALSS